LFELQDDGRYLLHAQVIREVSFPRSQIEHSLRELLPARISA
jgi:hypothetical protein